MVRDRARQVLASFQPRELPLEDRRAASVLLLLHRLDGEDHIIFQQRTEGVRHHKGEISFPGGARDPEDDSLLDTALRETREEIGVPSQIIEVFGQLDDTMTFASNYLIRPFVGAAPVDTELTFVEATREVKHLLHVPVQHLLSEEARTWKVAERDGVTESSPSYMFEGNEIWGATARMLGQFLELLDLDARHR